MNPENLEECIEMMQRQRLDTNKLLPFDSSLLKMCVCLRSMESVAMELSTQGAVTGLNEIIWGLHAITLIDQTSLSGDDTLANIRRMCAMAAHPLPLKFLYKELDREIHPRMHAQSVCVYPARVDDAYVTLDDLDMLEVVNIVAVATGFPSAQYCLQTRLREITQALLSGANEIDAIISRQLALIGDWEGVYNEVAAIRRTCTNRAKLKVILAIGELATMENVYKASMASMMGGADFIVTSTGKETVNAILPAGLTMIYAIREFKRRTCQIVGLKVQGGVCTIRDIIPWMAMVKETLGRNWLSPNLFRFGAPKLLENIVSFLLNGNQVSESKPNPKRKKNIKGKIKVKVNPK